MDQDEEKHQSKRIPRRYRRWHKTNKPKATTEEKEPKTTKPIDLVIFTFDWKDIKDHKINIIIEKSLY